MNETKVYIIDTNVLVRQTLVHIVRNSEGISYFGSTSGASFNDITLDIKDKKPHVLFLGINEIDSREMDLFNHLRMLHPSLPIVVLTPFNREGAQIAISCLKNGAVDFVTKPISHGRLILAKNHFAKRINPILKTIGRLNLDRQMSLESAKVTETPSIKGLKNRAPLEAIVIGGCTGGVLSMFEVIAKLPKNLSAPVIVVQHMPKLFTGVLAEELDNEAELNVFEAQNGSTLRAGNVYVIPGGYHAVIKNGIQRSICLHRGPREEDSRPSMNVLLRSASQVFQDQLLGAFLSGGGKDGILGAHSIMDKGGQIITESKESTLLWDVAKQMEDQGIVMDSYPAELISDEISKRVLESRNEKPLRKLKKSTNNFIATPGTI